MSDAISNAMTCAAEGCTNTIPDRTGTPGRPFKYCSPRCRPSRNQRRKPPTPLIVEVGQPDNDPAIATNLSRSWTVQLRRGANTVTVGQNLGRFSATALARDLQKLLDPQPEGGPIV